MAPPPQDPPWQAASCACAALAWMRECAMRRTAAVRSRKAPPEREAALKATSQLVTARRRE
eukprot:1243812-Rhodomonas_salina.3